MMLRLVLRQIQIQMLLLRPEVSVRQTDARCAQNNTHGTRIAHHYAMERNIRKVVARTRKQSDEALHPTDKTTHTMFLTAFVLEGCSVTAENTLA